MFREIMSGDQVAWYHLRLNVNGRPCIVIHPDAWPTVQAFAQQCMQTGLDPAAVLPEFRPVGSHRGWGLGPVLIETKTFAPWIGWEYQCPRLPGYGSAREEAYNRLHAISATLSQLFRALWVYGMEHKIANGQPQLVVFDPIGYTPGMAGSSLTLTLSRALRHWLAAHADTRSDFIRDAIFRQSEDLGATAEDRRESFEPRIRDRGLLFLLVASDVGLSPNMVAGAERHDNGYEMFSDNVDTPMLQLMLLAGVAAVCELYLREGG